uniref:ABC transmembrane type-1 domain-containing protein n=1 Tax=Macrostomum lignano TaxID=282301 RepID=A0A1I8FF40_9PLAT
GRPRASRLYDPSIETRLASPSLTPQRGVGGMRAAQMNGCRGPRVGPHWTLRQWKVVHREAGCAAVLRPAGGQRSTWTDTTCEDLNAAWLKIKIGTSCLREPVLFACSIADNVRMGRPDATMSEIEDACRARAKRAHNFICGLPAGYENAGWRARRPTKWRAEAEGGSGQSPSFASRCCCCWMKQLPHCDSESEAIVQAALDKASENTTTLVGGASAAFWRPGTHVRADASADESATHQVCPPGSFVAAREFADEAEQAGRMTGGQDSSLLNGSARQCLRYGSSVGGGRQHEMLAEATFWALMFLAVLGASQFVGHIISAAGMGISGERLTARLRARLFPFFDSRTIPLRALNDRDLPLTRPALKAPLGFDWRYLCRYMVAGAVHMAYQTRSQKASDKGTEMADETAAEAIENLPTVQSLGREEVFYTRYRDFLSEPYRKRLFATLLGGLTVRIFAEQSCSFIYAASFRFGGYLVSIDQMEVNNVFKVFFSRSHSPD